ncbi:MAG: asparaginase [Pyramidobacter sp.]
MGRLLVIFTGGTIASGFDGQGKTPLSGTSQRLHDSLTQILAERGMEMEFCQPLGDPGIDSSEMTPGAWLLISRCIAKELERGLSGVLILHGTDTMANTAAWLNLCFGRLSIPIILTGSQLTLDYMTEDVTTNLRGAAMACCADLKGVWIYFNWKLIPGDSAHKAHALHPDAFKAVNGQPLYFNPEWALSSAEVSDRQVDKSQIPWEVGQMLELDPAELNSRCSRISWYFAQPGTTFHWDQDDAILCLMGYGAGNLSPTVLDTLEKSCAGRKKPLIVACSQAEGGIKNPSSYDQVGMARLTRAGFTVWNQTERSVEFIHSLCCYALAVSPDAPGTVLGRYLRRC